MFDGAAGLATGIGGHSTVSGRVTNAGDSGDLLLMENPALRWSRWLGVPARGYAESTRTATNLPSWCASARVRRRYERQGRLVEANALMQSLRVLAASDDTPKGAFIKR